MRVSDLVETMQRLAPLEYAEPWDRVGLLVGDQSRDLAGPVLLTIDLTEAVLEEAISLGAAAIVAYHPPVWEPLSRITDGAPPERLVLRAAENRIAIYSPHTALDAMPAGLTDWLCEGLSGASQPGRIVGDCRALRPHASAPESQQVKIVTFVPEKDVEKVRGALATAGAGRIGRYQVCSFTTTGTGSFLGGEGAKPKVGLSGRLELVHESRLEMVCSRAGVALAVETLRRFHPYEEPAIDVYELSPQPRRGVGAGRRLVLDQPVSVGALAERLKAFLPRDDAHRIKLTSQSRDHEIKTIGVCAGSGAELATTARAEGCEVFVTGEMKHHEIMSALNSGMGVILAGHTNTERGFLPRLAERLRASLPGLNVGISTQDRDPLAAL